HVRLDRRSDRDAGLPGRSRVHAGIAPRVDHHGLPRPIAADEERRLRKTFVEESLKHAVEFRGASGILHRRASCPKSFRMSLAIVIAVIVAGAIAGCLGSLLGIGGGVFLVPFLNAILGLPFEIARAVSLMTVIATSSAVSAGTAGRNTINLRLGMVLEVGSATGGLLAGITVERMSKGSLSLIFAVVTALIA